MLCAIQGICLLILLTPFKYFCHVSNDFVSLNVSCCLPKGKFCQRLKKVNSIFNNKHTFQRTFFRQKKNLEKFMQWQWKWRWECECECSLGQTVLIEAFRAHWLIEFGQSKQRLQHYAYHMCGTRSVACNCRLSCQPFFWISLFSFLLLSLAFGGQ